MSYIIKSPAASGITAAIFVVALLTIYSIETGILAVLR